MAKDWGTTARNPSWQVLARKDVLSGLMFMVIGLAGLWYSRDYSVGTALRMGTGYVPRLLCWALVGLGLLTLMQGLRDGRGAKITEDATVPAWRPVIFVTASMVIFALSLETLGLVVSIALLTAIGAVAARMLRPLETLIAALVMIVLSWAIFIVGLGLVIPVWPEF